MIFYVFYVLGVGVELAFGKSMPGSKYNLLENSFRCTQEGLHPHPKDYKKFYQCVNLGSSIQKNESIYLGYEFECAKEKLFDPDDLICAPPETIKKLEYGGTPNEISFELHHRNKRQINMPYPNIYSGYNSQPNPQSPSFAGGFPSNFRSDICQSPGYFPVPGNCQKFVNCVDNGRGGFTKFEFSCGPGTVWDPALKVCNHAGAVPGCGMQQQEVDRGPSSRQTNGQMFGQENYPGNQGGSPWDNNYPQQSYTTKKPFQSTPPIPENSQSLSSSEECQSPGFHAVMGNCQKFIRCVENGNGGYTKFEFNCGPGTVWDPALKVCNHPGAVPGCGMQQQEVYNDRGPSSNQTNGEMFGQENYPGNQGGSPWDNNYAQQNHYTTKKPFQGVPPDNQGGNPWDNNYPQQSYTTKKPFQSTPPENQGGTPWDNNYPQQSYYTTKKPFQGAPPDNQGGTPWDNNYPQQSYYTTKKPFQGAPPDNQGGNPWDNNYPQQSYYTTKKPFQGAPPDNQGGNPWDNNYPQQSYATKKPFQSTPPISENNQPMSSSEECQSPGFHAVMGNCKKFIRCVENGKGGYTKFEFNCGPGTVWDSQLTTCNYPSSVKGCENSEFEPDQQQFPDQTGSNQISTDSKPCNTTQDLRLNSFNKNVPTMRIHDDTNESNKPSECPNAGSYPVPGSCKQYYSCIKDGLGGYKRVDFECKDDKMWDQQSLDCNYPFDVAKSDANCVNTFISKANTSPTTENQNLPNEPQTMTNPSVTSTPISNRPELTEKSSTNFMNPETTPNPMKIPEGTNFTPSAPTGSSPCSKPLGPIKCEKDGFYPDPNNCKKFYRCVDHDGDQGQRFSVYYFECASGTIWDPALQTCNHEKSVYPPRNCNEENTTFKPPNQTTSNTESISTNSSPETTPSSSTESPESTDTSPETPETTPSSSPEPPASTDSSPETTPSSSTESPESTDTSPETPETTPSSSPESPESTDSSPETTPSSPTESPESTDSSPETTPSSSTDSPESTDSSPESPASTDSSPETTPSSSTESPESTDSSPETTPSSSTDSPESTDSSPESPASTDSSPETTPSSSTESPESTDSSPETTSSSSTDSPESTDSSPETTSSSSTDSPESTDSSPETTPSSSTESPASPDSSPETTLKPSTPMDSKCPNVDDTQKLFVCPTGFKRHPKNCNMFYQCTSSKEMEDINVVTFSCTSNTYFDEKKIQCLPPEEAEPCKTEGLSRKTRNAKEKQSSLIFVSANKKLCPTTGSFPYEGDCSKFYKCIKKENGKITGYMYQCPENFYYSTKTNKCEKKPETYKCKRSIPEVTPKNLKGFRSKVPVAKQEV